MYDLVIRGGTVLDGSGGPSFRADVGIQAGRIVSMGRVEERGREELQADGLFVTPGFIDPHTHLDAQVCWDPLGTSSCWNGVTSVIMGNCGFTLAPSRENERELVMRTLERAEEIPRQALLAGVDFNWETFPEYLEVLEQSPKGINFGGYVGHSAIRTFVMGERGFDQPATEHDLREMRHQVRSSLEAGAFGLSTSRSPFHKTSDGRQVASKAAGWDELRQLAREVAETQCGLIQMSNDRFQGDPEGLERYLVLVRSLARETGRPITCQIPALESEAGSWREYLNLADLVESDGGRMICQSHARELINVLGFRVSLPYDKLPRWSALRARPLTEQRLALLNSETRSGLVEEAMRAAEGPGNLHGGPVGLGGEYARLAVSDGTVGSAKLVADIAAELCTTPVDVVIDLSLKSDFDQLFAAPIANIDMENVLFALRHRHSVVAASDSGAHVTSIMDASVPTYLLAYWVRMRQEFTWEEAVRMLTNDPARAWGLHDRGLLREGFVADLNVIDPQTVAPGRMSAVSDLPSGATRLIQGAFGIAATLVGGVVLMREGEHTGAYPGQVLKSGRSAR